MPKTVTIKGAERVPANKLALIVTQPSEKHYYDAPNTVANSQTIWKTPPIMDEKPPSGQNLIGTKRGMVTIVGYYGSNKTLKTSQWVAKCSCGNYILRNGKTWRKGLKNETFDCCQICKHINRMREGFI